MVILEVRYGLKQATKKRKISDRRVLQYCNDGRIESTEKTGKTRLIPQNAEKPIDKRRKRGKYNEQG